MPDHEMPAEGTIEFCQYMTRLLAQVISDDLGEVGLTPEDIERVGEDQEGVPTPYDTEHGATLANIRLLAVQEYKIRHGIPLGPEGLQA